MFVLILTVDNGYILLITYFGTQSLTQLITVSMSFLKNRDQLAQEYGVSRPTFYRMLERAGIALPARVQLSPAELEMVYEKLGRPPQENKNNTSVRGGG